MPSFAPSWTKTPSRTAKRQSAPCAYIGDFSLYAAHHLDARVFAFEPTAEHYEIAARNIELNRLEQQVTLLNKASAF